MTKFTAEFRCKKYPASSLSCVKWRLNETYLKVILI